VFPVAPPCLPRFYGLIVSQPLTMSLPIPPERSEDFRQGDLQPCQQR
jgi:hypothetical protein